MGIFKNTTRKMEKLDIEGQAITFYQLSAQDRIDYFDTAPKAEEDKELSPTETMALNLEHASLLIAYSLKPGFGDMELDQIQAEIKEQPTDVIDSMYEVAEKMAGFNRPEEEGEAKKS